MTFYKLATTADYASWWIDRDGMEDLRLTDIAARMTSPLLTSKPIYFGAAK